MKIDELEKILTRPRLNSRKNHFIAQCPFCDKEAHFYINVHKFNRKKVGRYISSWDCKSCSRKGNLPTLLKKLGKIHLLEGEEILIATKLPMLGEKPKEDEEENLYLPVKKLPAGFKRQKANKYLIERGFTELEFDKYTVGQTKILKKYRDYIIIAVEEAQKPRAFLSRSIYTKEKIDRINAGYKAKGLKKKYPRYRNSTDEYSKLLLGIDEIMFNTNWVVLVEGFFDKVKVDQAMRLDDSPDIKCCCTFGKEISTNHIKKLKRKGVKNIIIIQDPDAIEHTKHLAFRIESEFNEVLVGFTGHKDLGDSSYQEVIEVFEGLKTPFQFDLGIVPNTLKR